MENNGLSNENDVVFRDVILLALTGFISMVILLIPFVNPPTEEESSSTPPGNVIVELFWDDKRDVDIDLWVKAPDDIPVGYSNKGGLFFNLLRDDLGIYKITLLLIMRFHILEESVMEFTLQMCTFTEKIKLLFNL